jgi:hypothetical protein
MITGAKTKVLKGYGPKTRSLGIHEMMYPYDFVGDNGPAPLTAGIAEI